MENFLKIKKNIVTFFKQIKNTIANGKMWIGLDGLINMETSALLTIFLMIFFPAMWAMVFSLLSIFLKTFLDKTRGHIDERHDLICACIGALGGLILGLAHFAVVIMV